MNSQIQYSSEISEIKRKLWNGSINIKVVLQGDTKDIEYLINIYRNSYFPIYYQQLIVYFQNYISKDISKTAIWLEYEGVPISWNLPVGVLHDYLYLPSVVQKRTDRGSSESSESSENSECWTVQLKIEGKYPSEYIIPFVSTEKCINYEQCLTENLVNQIKQSCFVINGCSKPIMNLSKLNSKLLWNSIITRNLGQFTSLNKKFIPNKISNFQRIPIKIYIPGGTTVIQAPTNAIQENIPTTLGNLLQQQLPHLFTSTSQLANPYIHGINVTSIMDISLYDIWSIFRHLDNFLYIIIIVKP